MRNLAGMIFGAAAMVLAGCEGLPGHRDAPNAPPPEKPPVFQPVSAESAALKAYYTGIEQGHQTRGLLRADGGGPDVPFDERRLAETFMTVAFQSEFSDVGRTLVRRQTASMLHRWPGPILFEPVFGASVTEAQRNTDRANINTFAKRLGRITGHPVSTTDRAGNFRVLFLSEEERKRAGPLLARLIPGIRAQDIAMIETLPRESYCVVVAADPGNDGTLTRAVAVIRSELPPLLRLSCVHEELAQGLGLSNDSARARPSIFNDDDEFGRLTTMDEFMLSMLYDPRLTPGMDAETARPLVQAQARALLGASF